MKKYIEHYFTTKAQDVTLYACFIVETGSNACKSILITKTTSQFSIRINDNDHLVSLSRWLKHASLKRGQFIAIFNEAVSFPFFLADQQQEEPAPAPQQMAVIF